MIVFMVVLSIINMLLMQLFFGVHMLLSYKLRVGVLLFLSSFSEGDPKKVFLRSLCSSRMGVVQLSRDSVTRFFTSIFCLKHSIQAPYEQVKTVSGTFSFREVTNYADTVSALSTQSTTTPTPRQRSQRLRAHAIFYHYSNNLFVTFHQIFIFERKKLNYRPCQRRP